MQQVVYYYLCPGQVRLDSGDFGFGYNLFFSLYKKALLAAVGIYYLAGLTLFFVGTSWGTAERNYLKSHPTKGMQDNAVRSYGQCLNMLAQERAQKTDDQPSVIERWSLDKCARERKALFDDYQVDPAIVAAFRSMTFFQIRLSPLIDEQRRRWPKRN